MSAVCYSCVLSLLMFALVASCCCVLLVVHDVSVRCRRCLSLLSVNVGVACWFFWGWVLMLRVVL